MREQVAPKEITPPDVERRVFVQLAQSLSVQTVNAGTSSLHR